MKRVSKMLFQSAAEAEATRVGNGKSHLEKRALLRRAAPRAGWNRRKVEQLCVPAYRLVEDLEKGFTNYLPNRIKKSPRHARSKDSIFWWPGKNTLRSSCYTLQLVDSFDREGVL